MTSKETVVNLYISGKSVKEIAEKFGEDFGVIIDILSEAGYQVKSF